MNWPGKADCFKTIQAPSMGTLRPCREESVNFDTTENMIIEGDNLEVLKLLQKSYLGKVKMIYIDPPYNTGNDFIYPDNYSESLNTYLQYTGQVDDEGRKFGSNTEADGRFHSKWMNMMYPRLYLARNLLRDDGVICISIDDHEFQSLRLLLNELFGEENFIATCIWQKRYSRENRGVIGDVHDYLVFFARNLESYSKCRNLLPLNDHNKAVYKNPNNDQNGLWQSVSLSAQGYRPNQMYEIIAPNGTVHRPPEGRCWSLTKPEFDKLVEQKRLWFGADGNGVPRVVRYLSEVEGLVPWTWWPHDEVGHTDEAKKEIHGFFGKEEAFDTPKPVRLMKRVLHIGVKPTENAIVLDFFAGSGTLGQAVLELNETDGGNRKFVLVQLPEPTGTEELKTIAKICQARIRKVCQKLIEENNNKLNLDDGASLDRGYRAFRLSESNFNTWNSNATQESKLVERQLELHIDHIRDGRSQEDILYELLLKSGFPLTTPVEVLSFNGRSFHREGEAPADPNALKKVQRELHPPELNNEVSVYSIAGGALMICLEDELTLELIRAIADLKPERVVLLDQGFAGKDQLKANAVQTFKTKGVASFRTV